VIPFPHPDLLPPTVIALQRFISIRMTFAMKLESSSSSVTANQYFSLIGMSLVEMAWGITLTALSLWNSLSGGLRPWTSWANVHADLSRVDLVTMGDLPQQRFWTVMALWWTMPVASIIFFVFFAISGEAVAEYRRLCLCIRRRVTKQNIQKVSVSLLSISQYVLSSMYSIFY